MTDPRLETLVGVLRGQGWRAELRDDGVEHVVIPLDGSSQLERVEIQRTRGGWQLEVVGVRDLEYRSTWVQPDDGPPALLGMQLDLIRSLVLRQVPDQGRDPQPEPLSCPVRDGMEVPGGVGAQDLTPRWVSLIGTAGAYAGMGGVFAFAGYSEPSGPIDSGWALAGALGSFGVTVGSVAWVIWYAGRLRRRRRVL